MIVSFSGYRPPPRYDSIPWTQVRVDEAAGADGPWTTIDTLDLDPVDVDPKHPQLRSFTADDASDTPNLWYQATFLDADGRTSLPSAPVQNPPPVPGNRDLCTLADVTSYVPAYASDEQTDEKLRQLIAAESDLIASQTGREIVGPPDPETRRFDIRRDQARRRVIELGDLASLADATLTICTWNDTAIRELADADMVALYDGDRQPTAGWQPITAVDLPDIRLAHSTILKVEDATWGFPAIPSFVTEACAKRVILRYISDVAVTGTDFSQAVLQSDLNLAAMFDSSQDALRQLEISGVMIS